MRLRNFAAAALALVALPLFGAQHVNLAKGFNPNSVYQTNDYDSINAFNGNLTLSVPIGNTYSITDGFPLKFVLYNNSNVWESETYTGPGLNCTPDAFSVAFPHRGTNAGIGWVLTLGRLTDPNDPRLGNGNWVYESPDGAEHQFLTIGGIAADNILYSGFLRMTIVNGVLPARKIEFPDGTVQTFEPDAFDASQWLLTKMGNRFNEALVTISYVHDTDHRITQWNVNDTVSGHTHLVHFAPLEYDHVGSFSMFVSKIELMRLDGIAVSYDLEYKRAVVGRQLDMQTAPKVCTQIERTAVVELLSAINLADGSRFDFSYNESRGGIGPIALPLRMTLPTGGSIQWAWERYDKPGWSADEVYYQYSWGIETRTVFPRGSTTPSGVWDYDARGEEDLDYSQDDPNKQQAIQITTITDPAGKKTESYFNVFSNWPINHLEPGKQYGRPFSQLHPDGSSTTIPRYLSLRTLVGDVPQQSTYVRYEDDLLLSPPNEKTGLDAIGRVVSQRVVQDSDPISPLVPRYVDTDYSRYDGLGHYRVSTTSGTSLGKIGTSPGIVRTTTTEYAMDSEHAVTTGDVILPKQDKPWITGLYTSVTATESQPGTATSTSSTQYQFNQDNGFLHGTRTIRGSGKPDLFTVFTPDAFGNVKDESYYGGDVTPVITRTLDSLIGTPTAETVRFKLIHEYTDGVRRQTKYNGVSFLSADFEIDETTRLAKISRDSAQVATSYGYDPSGRITKVTPADGAWTSYAYTAATAAAPASVTVSQYPEDGPATPGTELTQARYYYDGFGRVVQESRKMPVDWSTTWTAYDVFGHKVAITTARSMPNADYSVYPTGLQSQVAYDTLGRVIQSMQPDGKTATVAYTGTRLTTRTAEVAVATSQTATTNPVVEELAQSTREEVDAFGRLVKVTENSGGVASSPSYETQYQYDVGDRLTTVTMPDLIDPDHIKQTRTFTYDGAGLLLSEQHPESGTTSYEYNARGQVLKRTIATGTVMTYTYDSAERLTDVKQDGAKFKEFRFDRAGDPLGLGRPDYSLRYNRDATLTQPITVKEKYSYDSSGRLSKKETSLGAGDSATPTGETFTDTYQYDALSALEKVGYPSCVGCSGLVAPARDVVTQHKNGLTTRVGGYTSDTSDILYWPSGLVKNIPHRNVIASMAGPLYEQGASSEMARAASIKVTNVCTDLTVTSPSSGNGQLNGNVTLAVTASSGATVQWYERTATGDTAISNATSSSYSAVVATAPKTYFARASNGSCTVDSDSATVTVNITCGNPGKDVTVSPSTLAAYGSGTASVTATAGASYLWTIPSANGTINGSATGTTVSFTASCPGVLTLKVVVTTGCTSVEGTADVEVTPLQSHTTGSATITFGSSTNISATLPGQGNWSVVWSDDPTPITYTSSPAVHPVSPVTTQSYSVVSFTDGNGCTGVNDGSVATVTVVGGPTCTTPNTDMAAIDSEMLASVKFQVALINTTAGEHYQWTVTNGTDLGSTLSGTRRIQAGCAGQLTVTLTITAACGAQRVRTQTATILSPLAEITSANSGPYSYTPGGTAVTLRADVRGALPTVTWSDGYTETVRSGGVSQRFATPPVSTIYNVASIVDFNGCTGTTLGQAVVNVCTPPPASITVSSPMHSFATQQASVPATPGATYDWTVTNGTLVTGQGTSTISFKAACSGNVSLSVSVTNSCGTTPGTASVSITPAPAIVSGSTSIGQGSSTSIQVTLPGTGPWSVLWADQSTAVTVTASPYTRTVSPVGTTTYTLTSASSNGCALAPTGSAVVTVVPPAPGALVALATSATQVRVTWTSSGTADTIRLYRDGTLLSADAASPYTDTVGSATAHTYYAIAVKNGTSSPRSALDLATTVIFTDPVILPGLYDRKAVHVTQLRTAVNAVRAAAGMAAATFTDSVLTDVMPKAVHIQELQDRLEEARIALGLTATGYTRRPVAGQYMQTIDVIGLRGAVQ
jgi:YD repeat-containing protein